ncbi:hypothetical protein P0W64_15580 [Tsukamurella sp. 8F]|uniref:hypothetical protein n=1 Tax=unclassified Tsukamurella TaxID=2633480 RepID=UPI0023B9FFE4|nr:MULTISPECIES: hypothetical protein [unclassified Tsukamurella]MDF0530855.1 hypothetical protein [Tsukamurella sp. 8J]MDF0588200.1 hypothetical protein [Tsukamurella sp. 8F]
MVEKGRGARRLSTSAALAVGLLGLAGCATAVPGTGGADVSQVASYKSAVAAKAAAQVKAACADWDAGVTTRRTASKATAAYTKNPTWTWPGIMPLVRSELTAVENESRTVPSLITRATSDPEVVSSLRDYQTKLDAYSSALRADSNAKGSGASTWPTANTARDKLLLSQIAVEAACKS